MSNLGLLNYRWHSCLLMCFVPLREHIGSVHSKELQDNTLTFFFEVLHHDFTHNYSFLVLWAL